MVRNEKIANAAGGCVRGCMTLVREESRSFMWTLTRRERHWHDGEDAGWMQLSPAGTRSLTAFEWESTRAWNTGWGLNRETEICSKALLIQVSFLTENCKII